MARKGVKAKGPARGPTRAYEHIQRRRNLAGHAGPCRDHQQTNLRVGRLDLRPEKTRFSITTANGRAGGDQHEQTMSKNPSPRADQLRAMREAQFARHEQLRKEAAKPATAAKPVKPAEPAASAEPAKPAEPAKSAAKTPEAQEPTAKKSKAKTTTGKKSKAKKS